ncbi:hypothetical protein C5L39_10560 [Corynebacterium alimapuense]|uniref:HTH cro/C1-type domain-containing protein n=1 Tax=Corynebacterium alimapuense TaxID=1576874 RepID=A0A3M8K4L6_9CORY|nr:hypothetical protein C5L39_10560 [Corynebacterium alimapuense]
MSQEELVHRVGMHRTYASSVECGERNISVLNLVSLASALEVDPGEFIAGLAREPRHVQK